MKGQFLLFFFLGFIALGLTSCFEIVEEVNFNDDGSGKVILTLNMSKSKTKLNSILLLDSINGYKIPSKDDVRKQITTAVNQIKQVKGVSNVTNTINFSEYIFTVTCDFTDVDALNTIISNFSTKEDATRIKSEKHFTFDKAKHTFSRDYHYDISKEFKKTKMKDRGIFETASFTTIYRFKTPIISSQNKTARIAGSKKAVMLKVNAQDIITNKNTIKNQIKLQY